MRILNRMAVAGVALLASAGAACASHGKAGLWNVTVTLGGASVDMSKIRPDLAAKMRAAGIGANAITVPHCMTAAEVATDMPHLDPRNMRGCTIAGTDHSGHTLRADLICNADFKGTEHVQITYDSDTHYSGIMKMSGTVNGRPMDREQTVEGRWVSASCGGVDH
ncbi:MAG: DUF3617 domain-containing protein [Rhizomicrobium sp.]